MKLFSPVIVVELIATLVAFILFARLKRGKLNTLPFFLLFITGVELYGRYLTRIEHVPNVPLYKFSILFEYLYYLYLIRIHGEKPSRLTSNVLSLILVGICIFIYIKYPLTEFISFQLLAGQFATIILILVYLLDFIRTDNEVFIQEYAYFVWIAGGLLVFNLGDLVYVYLIPVTNRLKWDEFGLVFTSINNKLNYGLYACYIIAMLVHGKKKIHG